MATCGLFVVDDVIVTRRELADRLGVHPDRITLHARQGHIPRECKAPDGKGYWLERTLKAIEANADPAHAHRRKRQTRPVTVTSDRAEGEDFATARTRKMVHEANLKQRQDEAQAARVADVAGIERALSFIFGELRAQLEERGPKLAHQVQSVDYAQACGLVRKADEDAIASAVKAARKELKSAVAEGVRA